jgi:serine/threonine-protein kinase
VATKASELGARVSPDGRWVAYLSDETGRNEILVRSFPKADQRRQISKGADSGPVWSRNGREIFYRSGDRMMAVAVRTAPTFTSGTPQALFEWTFGDWDVSPDGQRFVTIQRPRRPQAPPQLVVVPDFLDELRARLRPVL